MSRPLLVLTAHGSADARSARTVRAIADAVRLTRPSLEVQVAFCENSDPLLGDVLAALPRHRRAVVVPLLLAAGYHARTDIPAVIAEAGADVELAAVLGEDDRLVHVLRQRLEQAGVSRLDPRVGVLIAAVGSSHRDANAGTATLPRAGIRAADHDVSSVRTTPQLLGPRAGEVPIRPRSVVHGRSPASRSPGPAEHADRSCTACRPTRCDVR